VLIYMDRLLCRRQRGVDRVQPISNIELSCRWTEMASRQADVPTDGRRQRWLADIHVGWAMAGLRCCLHVD